MDKTADHRAVPFDARAVSAVDGPAAASRFGCLARYAYPVVTLLALASAVAAHA